MSTISSKCFTDEVVQEISKIIKRGNSAELKKENNKLVVVEIQRKAKIKTSITG